MGLLNEVIGAVVAVEGAKKLDPGASLLTEGIAAIAGFEGVKAVTEHLEKKEEGDAESPAPPA
ncbi:hypothetical protein D9M73_67120 [compost metagenome]|uniref:Uncharacterized protein n=1 Tax=Polaromonas aquatica TaxID=332657 RepID=A0ABW1TV21_9BURK